MSASNPSGGRIAAENELLAQLGLPPSASPEDVDQLHLAVSQFLAAAPAGVKGWARAQASALDEAYLTLTDPVGLEGSALRSPTRPPTVVPGGPATPPARRGPAPAVAAVAVAAQAAPLADKVPADVAAVDDTDTDDIDALFASVTPGAHRDLTSGGKPDQASAPEAAAAAGAVTAPKAKTVHRQTSATRVQTAAQVAQVPEGPNIWKRIALGGAAVIAILAIGFGVSQVISGGAANGGVGQTQPSPTAQAVDLSKVNTLMKQLAANPKDVDTLIALGDEYYFGNQYDVAGQWYTKALVIDPKNVKALNALGAVQFSSGDLKSAQTTWNQVLTLDAKNTEAHFNLAFLYFTQTPPDLTGAVREWNTVLQLDPSSTFAQVAQQHLQSLAAASMIPAASGTPSASGSPAPSGAAPSSAAVPSGAPAPSASAAAAASPASTTVNEGAQNLAFTSGTLNAPANTTFTIHFNNQDAGLPHDMLVKDASGNTVFKGDMVTGPAAVDYQVPALAAGTYTFSCTVHPTTMNGTLVVGG